MPEGGQELLLVATGRLDSSDMACLGKGRKEVAHKFIDITLILVLRPLALLFIEMRPEGIISTAQLALFALSAMAASLTELQCEFDSGL